LRAFALELAKQARKIGPLANPSNQILGKIACFEERTPPDWGLAEALYCAL
jgi:hypothetical protein